SVVGAEPGPTITMFELSLAAGIKVSQISNLSNDVARALGAAAVRVVAPLPGRHTIGIEVPNSQKETVRMKDLFLLAGNRPDRMHIPLFLGKDSSGEALVSDLAEMPHLLIAGTTGSGKSVCINSIVTSIMMLKRPDEVKLILIDPKMVEMAAFARIPHLMSPIITEVNRAEQILEWATTKMDERYALLAEAGVKNIAGFNKLGTEEVIARLKPATKEEEAMIPKRLPYFVIIVDELADLMMTAAKEIEAYVVRLAQKSRAVGIHIILATQRPQATVVTGLIKSNLPSRISFRVASRIDSRIVLDQNGAETLLGQGDMLFLKPGTSDVVRAQGAFVDDDEIKRIVKHLTDIAEPQFHPELMQLNKVDASTACDDEMFDEAVRTVLETKRGSVSLLQRKLSVGYARASRMIEAMAASGILGEYKGSQAREVMLTLEEYERSKREAAADEYHHRNDHEDDEDDTQESTEYDYVAVDEE
ncbi:MAG: DNA translocase FtsK, partial [Planctomycetes bacterium]|nr:DNA translocase FtsK [Planctomycetota bacterium]